MKNLARHIELLLRDNDCVILPGFGGFIAHDVPAYYVSEEGLYYPPSRSISFNASITMNDGLLAQSYMKSYQVDYARATYMVDTVVEQLTDILDEEGCVTLPRIGTLTQDIHGAIQFRPDVVGIAAPMFFGLDSFVIKEVSQLSSLAETPRKPKAERKTKAISMPINKEMLHRVMSTAAIFLLLLMVALPIGNHRPTDIASLHLTELITSPQIVPSEVVPAPIAVAEGVLAEVSDTAQPVVPLSIAIEERMPAIETENTIVATEEDIVPMAEESIEAIAPITEVLQPAAIVAQPTKIYHIIVASLPGHRGADETLAQYISQGYTDASLVEGDNRVRISLVQFADKGEANKFLSTLRQNEKFQNAWLLAVRN